MDNELANFLVFCTALAIVVFGSVLLALFAANDLIAPWL